MPKDLTSTTLNEIEEFFDKNKELNDYFEINIGIKYNTTINKFNRLNRDDDDNDDDVTRVLKFERR